LVFELGVEREILEGMEIGICSSGDISDAAMNKDITVVQFLRLGYNSIYQYFKHFDY
jgi:hypothetical protein